MAKKTNGKVLPLQEEYDLFVNSVKEWLYTANMRAYYDGALISLGQEQQKMFGEDTGIAYRAWGKFASDEHSRRGLYLKHRYEFLFAYCKEYNLDLADVLKKQIFKELVCSSDKVIDTVYTDMVFEAPNGDVYRPKEK